MNLNILKIYFDKYKHIALVLVFIAASSLLFAVAELFQQPFEAVINESLYLTWHSLFEFAGILVCFAVFVSSYYTYSQTKNLRSMVLGAVFLMMGILDLLHALSYKGMPEFFMVNCCANRATTFWVFSRLLGSIGIIIATFIKSDRKSEISRYAFVIPSVIISMIVFVLATYFPSYLPRMYIEGTGLTSVKIVLEYLVIIFLLFSTIRFSYEFNKTNEHMVLLFAEGLVLHIFSELAFVSYSSPFDIHNFIGHIYKVLAFYLFFKGIFIISVQRPYMELTLARNELKSHVENLDIVINERTRQLKDINNKLIEDLEYARDIQLSMLPASLLCEDEVCFSARYLPAERVGGDYYNIFKIDDNNIGFYLGDVSGHGVAAAMMTVFIRQSIRTLREIQSSSEDIADPSFVLRKLYEFFNNTNFRDEVYVVMLYAVYNFKTRELTYSSAGLNSSPKLVKSSGAIESIELKGFPICKFMDYYKAEYNNVSIKLDSGDRLLLYTDGLVEARNNFSEEYSERRLEGLLKESAGRSADQITECITKNVTDFIANTAIRDDITFFVMEVN